MGHEGEHDIEGPNNDLLQFYTSFLLYFNSSMYLGHDVAIIQQQENVCGLDVQQPKSANTSWLRSNDVDVIRSTGKKEQRK